MSHLIARQPICNASLKVVGYELLHRMDNNSNHANIKDADNATIDVLLAAYNDLSINDVVGEQSAFINFTSNIILNELPPISPKQLVIELLENQEITPDLTKKLKQLRQKGYKIALDDFCLTKETVCLIECADIIKVDVLEDSVDKWTPYMPKLIERGITMLAEKVEDYETYEACKNMGFSLFQGYFFSKPKVISGKKMAQNEISIIHLLEKLNKEDIDYDEVVEAISKDVSLSYNLLRTINSGMYQMTNKIGSIRQAAVSLGISHLKKWANFMALSSLDNKPVVLIEQAKQRAKMCELLSEHLPKEQEPDVFFTMGLFSILDALFDVPMQELLEKLSLDKELSSAILSYQGIKGSILKVVINYEKNKPLDATTVRTLRAHNINQAIVVASYLESIQWCNDNSL